MRGYLCALCFWHLLSLPGGFSVKDADGRCSSTSSEMCSQLRGVDPTNPYGHVARSWGKLWQVVTMWTSNLAESGDTNPGVWD